MKNAGFNWLVASYSALWGKIKVPLSVMWRRMRAASSMFFHFMMRRNVLAVISGVVIMYGATIMYTTEPFFHKLTWEVIALTFHAIGGIPIVKHVEPFWAMVAGEIETIAEEV